MPAPKHPDVILGPGETVVVVGASPVAYNRDTKTKTRVRVTDPRPYVEPPPPVEPPPVTPPPTVASMYRSIYGSGVSADSKDNVELGKVGQQAAHRIIESSDAPVTSLAVNWRGGSGGYGLGNGGTIRISKQTDSGGEPSGVILGTPVIVRPGLGSTAGENKAVAQIPNWPSVKGRTVHYVFENVDPKPDQNWISLNETTVLGQVQASPAFTSAFAVLSRIVPPLGNGAWKVRNNLPVMDVGYSDGTHDGNGYFQTTYVEDLSTTGIISGVQQARQTIKPKSPIAVRSLGVRVKRVQGTGPLTLTLDGTGRAVTIDGSWIPLSPYPKPASSAHWDEASLAGARWLVSDIPVTVLGPSQYYLRMSCPADTIYLINPLREVGNIDQSGTSWGSRVFRDGEAEYARDGKTWQKAYKFDDRHDWPFALDVAS